MTLIMKNSVMHLKPQDRGVFYRDTFRIFAYVINNIVNCCIACVGIVILRGCIVAMLLYCIYSDNMLYTGSTVSSHVGPMHGKKMQMYKLH